VVAMAVFCNYEMLCLGQPKRTIKHHLFWVAKKIPQTFGPDKILEGKKLIDTVDGNQKSREKTS